ncbi:MAG: hypothetical protein QOI10_1189 [Solirubrobacterales bacterium]|jgi:hypothetical protein|nr:hypothetical protein [Solirubrobacterales bacterium]
MSSRSISIGVLAAIGAVTVSGCGGGDRPVASTTTVPLPSASTTTVTSTSEATRPGEAPGPAETATADPRVNALERRAERTARDYIEALDARDGASACALLAPGVIDEVQLPEPRAGCAASLEASIGYRDPRGLPVWAGVKVTDTRIAELDGRSATVVASVVTTFADRDEKSIEDDIVYLSRNGGRWLVAKPSATLYRAVGIADIPPSVLSPPS